MGRFLDIVKGNVTPERRPLVNLSSGWPSNARELNRFLKENGLGEYKARQERGYVRFIGPDTHTWYSSSVMVVKVDRLTYDDWRGELLQLIETKGRI